MSNSILQHQCELVDKAKQLLVEHKQVGLDVFTRGGKSFIAMDLIEYLYDNHGCRTFVYLAPKSIVNNQKTNTFKNFKYKNNITFISKEMMSRGVALEELIYSYGLNPDAVDVIIIDEAHTFFGKNIGNEVSIAKDYLHSKYIIAMTATPVNNLSGINSLASLVHRDCILHYTFDKAVEENVITKVKYIPAVLKYDKKCYEKLDNLCRLIESGNTYLINLYEELEQAVNVLNGSVEDKVFEYIKDRLTLNCSEGARVFTFFNTMDEVINNEQTVVNIITRLYRYWGNTDVTVNYHPYISCNSKTEDDSVLEVIGSESMPNTIDVIATVNKGALGIHPSNVHFGLVLCGTKSIPKYLQMIGRLTNLEYFDANDTVIFDLRDNGSFLGNKSIYVGRQKTLNRRAITRERALTNLLGAELKQDLDKSVRLMPCEELEYTMSLFDRINNLITLTTGNEAIIKLLNNNIKTIDKLYNGNVSKFLEDKVKYFDGRGKKVVIHVTKIIKTCMIDIMKLERQLYLMVLHLKIDRLSCMSLDF